MPFWEMLILSMLSIYDDLFVEISQKDQAYTETPWISFVDSLVVLGYIVQNEEGKYELAVDFDKERLTFYFAEILFLSTLFDFPRD